MATVPLFEDRSRAESFGSVADLYDRARPSYPPALIDALLADGGRTVLDVGCGTGIAAALFAARGCAVTGVEVDARMAEIARRKGLEVEVSTFERWDDRGRRFDVVASGQAWHWIEPRVGAARAADLLRPGGRIGAFWNFGDPPPELRERLAPIYDRLAPELVNYSVVLDTAQRAERVDLTVTGIADQADSGDRGPPVPMDAGRTDARVDRFPRDPQRPSGARARRREQLLDEVATRWTRSRTFEMPTRRARHRRARSAPGRAGAGASAALRLGSAR